MEIEKKQLKLSGAAAQALVTANRRDVAGRPDGSQCGRCWAPRPCGTWSDGDLRCLEENAPYTLATDEPLTTPQAIAVCKVSPLVEVQKPNGTRYRRVGGAWEALEPGSAWCGAMYYPGVSQWKAWRLVAGDVRDEATVQGGAADPPRRHAELTLEQAPRLLLTADEAKRVGEALPGAVLVRDAYQRRFFDDRWQFFFEGRWKDCDSIGPIFHCDGWWLESVPRDEHTCSCADMDDSPNEWTCAVHGMADDVREEKFPTVGQLMEAAKRGLACLSEAEVLARQVYGEEADVFVSNSRASVRIPDEHGGVTPILIIKGPDNAVALGALGAALSVLAGSLRRHTLTLPHRTPELSEAGRHAEGRGVVEDSDGDLYRIRDGAWEVRMAVHSWQVASDPAFALGTYVLHPADYRDDAEHEPEPVKPRRGAELRRWLHDTGRKVRGAGGMADCLFWFDSDSCCFLVDWNGDGCPQRGHWPDPEEGVPESGTWESES